MPDEARAEFAMNSHEKYLARILFRLLVHSSDGQAFEDVFTQIMGYTSADFTPVKPQGQFGDRKNDGYDRGKGHYYQVYAPEIPDSALTRSKAVTKLAEDFLGLLDYWHGKYEVKRFSFVFNDKFKGSFPTIEADLLKIKDDHELEHCGCFLAKHLEDELFTLADDQIFMVVGGIPDPNQIQTLDYSILNHVVAKIRAASHPVDQVTVLEAPDFEDKMAFNSLSVHSASLLRVASYQSGHVDKYFKLNSTFAKQELRDELNRIYLDVKQATSTTELKDFQLGDLQFFELLRRITPSADRGSQDAALVVMAYFFESCDIFEDPKAAQ